MCACKQIVCIHINWGQRLCCALFRPMIASHSLLCIMFINWALNLKWHFWSLLRITTCGESPCNDRGQAWNVPLWCVEANDAHRMRFLQTKVDKCLCQASNLESVRKQFKDILVCFFLFLLSNLLLILCKCPLHPCTIPFYGKSSSIWHLDFQIKLWWIFFPFL